ncbi:HNH endonuclease [Gordonia phage Ghobes]|uniref:HNH endonuclease n=1 Tax=Gordonia phage Ghobes TaxID=1887647 RepID=A0A1B3B059_9CAUD|nr:HNH endonuclease [Gordonia phage Ghobes]AOE44410.1 HNH endonuclease [Gordonia phage Ghobes]
MDCPCWLCGQPVDWTVKGGPEEPDGFSLDHYYPWSTHPEYRLDPGNFRCAHWLCNSDRGDKEATPALGEPSRVW